jgi:Na+-translocating ferredoxin:NAD+ oxidoreductase subunit D
MSLPVYSSPHFGHAQNVTRVMAEVLLALVPAIIAIWWYFGWGVIVNIVIATIAAIATEAAILKVRNKPLKPLSDLSAVVTAVLFAVAVPQLLPWWMTVLAMVFAILVVKQLYGGLGYNPFNPAMAAYVFLLISFPAEMSAWLPPAELNQTPLSLGQTISVIFTGNLPQSLSWDAVTMATPLDVMRTELAQGAMISEIRQSPMWGDFGIVGGEWVGNWILLGKTITWHIPVSMLGAVVVFATAAWLAEPEAFPNPLFHVFSGGLLLGAFFIATDPVSAATTKKGQLIYGALIGLLVIIIRTWGNYPDAVAFAVLLMNMAAPTIDYYTQPRIYGEQERKREP